MRVYLVARHKTELLASYFQANIRLSSGDREIEKTGF